MCRISFLLRFSQTTTKISDKSQPMSRMSPEIFSTLEPPPLLHYTILKGNAIIHCASAPQNAQKVDVEGTRLLLQTAVASGTPHIVYPSIVGIDRSAYSYYIAKRETEGVIEQGPLPWTIVRATQFHDYVLRR